jgi:peptidoglycan/xylan/chitin deacetylase (PgdA/CDA1 family)
MDWPEIQQLHRAGVTFGSHLATHRRSSQLTMDELVEEGARSRFQLEERLESPVRSIAMPFGIYDRRVLAALEWSGYEIGYTVEDGVAAVGMNPLALPRVEVKGGESLDSFVARMRNTWT